jgi:uncharacterized protein
VSSIEPIVADYVLAALICALSISLIFRKVSEAQTVNRISFYMSASVMTLGLAAALVGFWAVNDRQLNPFGLYPWIGDESLTLALSVGWIAALVLTVQLIKQGLFRAPLTRLYSRYEQLMPTNRSEFAASWLTSLSAGIGEEIVYRGFLMWLAVSLTGVPAGLLLTSLLFGAAHGYQSRVGMIVATVAALLLGGVYLASGSLFLVILMHATYDIASFRTGMVLLRGRKVEGAALAG